MAKVIECGHYQGPVNAGEQRLLTYLEAKLPDNFFILPGIELPYTNPKNQQVQYLEYDCLVITPHALFNIENKDYKGRLEGDDNYWYHNDKELRNPLKTARFKTSVVASKLKEHQYAWAKAWVQSLVTLSHPLQRKQGLYGDCVKATFLLNEALVEHITNPASVDKPANNLADIYMAIKDYLCGTASHKKPEQKREVEGYEILEILHQDKSYTEYLVKPKGVTSAIRKRVKEYALNVAGLNMEERIKREEQIKNQYKALNKIKSNPFILNVQFKIDEENHQFYEITDFLDENSLQAELKHKTFTQEEKLNIIFNLIEALKAAHEVNIFHRDINPENVYMTNGYACLGNFGKSYFLDHYEQGYTVMGTLTEVNATPYHAVELLAHDASRASDIYSIGVLAYELFVGKVPVASPFEMNKLGKLPEDRMPTKINASLPTWLDEFCRHTLLADAAERWDSLEEMETFLREATKEINEEGPAIIAAQANPTPSSNGEINFEIGSRVGDFTVYNVLGKGGYSQVFKVKHSLQGTEYAMKVFHESVNASTVLDEYNALQALNHPNVVQFKWNGTLPSGQFYTLMEYLDGENLKTYTQGDVRMPMHRVYQAGKDILSALVEMQAKNPPLFHRDIKPQNIVWDKQKRFVLIDFNVALAVEGNQDFVGTNPYVAPDLIGDQMKVSWDRSADTFALGITLYELACKQYPWPSKMPLMNKEPIQPKGLNLALSDKFSDFLLKAINTRKEKRFATAKEMLDALLAVGEDNLLATIAEQKVEVMSLTNDGEEQNFVSYLNSLYSQSKHGNAGTRASYQRSAFDTATYIQTKLDDKLIPAILDGAYKLVIITGNAGDGKTAFIQKVEDSADKLERFTHQNGARFTIHGTTYLSNYDGSQDQEERANNQVLAEFFAPFAGLTNFSEAKQGRIIAINEGRLVEFLQSSGEFKSLVNIIEEYFYKEGHTILPEGLMIINLNLRSVVASEKGTDSLFRKQIKALTQKVLWKKCEGCSVAEKCFIRYNAESFNDTSAGDEVITRMEWLLRTAHMKRELHITMRDLRSMIAYMLTRDYRCEDIPQLLHEYEFTPEEYWQLYYFNITASVSKEVSQDRFVRLIQETDIAQTAVPSADRDLYFGLHKKEDFLEFSERNANLIDAFNRQKDKFPAHEQSSFIQNRVKQIHRSFVRHQYFEGKTNYKKRLPYHSIFEFYEVLNPTNFNDQGKLLAQTKKTIAQAISLNEGCDNPSIASRHLVLSSANTGDPLSKSFRLFSLEDFELLVNQSGHLVSYLEYEPESLTFKHKKESHIVLTITLDLYEMLYFIRQGYSPSLNDLRGRFVELVIFKNLLENLSYENVIVSKDNVDFYSISKEGAHKLVLTPFNIT